VQEAPEAPARPEAASSAVLRPKAAEPATVRDVERAARADMPLAPKAPGARSAPDEFLSIYSPFNLISDSFFVLLYCTAVGRVLHIFFNFFLHFNLSCQRFCAAIGSRSLQRDVG
jgi:hypothetical protein